MTLPTLPHEDLGQEWAARRGVRRLLHVDTAACGRSSAAVRARIAEHLIAESDTGGYVAEGEAQEELDRLQTNLANLIGFAAEDIVFLESASTALAQLLSAWPFETGQTVWAVRSEWGPNLAAFADRGLVVEFLDVDDAGVLDLDALAARLRIQRPAAVHLTAAASHRALLQPIAAAAAVCGAAEVPLIVDSAQALGQIEIEPGAAATYGTSRKWLCGPRGVGFLAVREPWQSRLMPVAPALSNAAWPSAGGRPLPRLGSREAFVGGRLGLGVAIAEHLELGPARIRERLHGIAVALRTAFADLSAWRLNDAIDAPGALVTLAPKDDGLDVAEFRAALLSRGVLCTAAQPERAPHEMTGYLLRFSPHLETTLEDVEQIAKRVDQFRIS
ncbi:MAG TPA: aminotransferase class V-fold PLP-dependent enzyme [Pseudonocardiaceae bacterium]|nr:aminotransferase class V-fold PLP-dependent enzyme [Pseudonocardiaceae bacterium]